MSTSRPPEPATEAPRRPARARIFESAKELFYRQGIHAVGVEAIAQAAGATKMSLYRNFPSKDALVRECLADSQQRFWAWWDAVVEPHAGEPRAQLEALLDAIERRHCEDAARGCPLTNAAVELTEPDHPGREVVLAYKAEKRRRLTALCEGLGARAPQPLADALLMLIEGAELSRLSFCGQGPVRQLKAAAAQLLASDWGPPPS